jgi:rhodanese-related sulfurtransferase
MKRTYLIPALIFFLLSAVLIFLPERESLKETEPGKIIASLNEPFRYISTDDVAARIIKNDPALCLVDVRQAPEFNDFSLQGAVNIPLEKMLDPEYQSLLQQKGMDYIFYSNGDITAENAWLIGSRLGLKNLYIMKGGLNEWTETIFNPTVPLPTAPSESWAQYDARMAAKQFFLGTGTAPQSTQGKADENNSAQKKIKPVKKEAESSSEGC